MYRELFSNCKCKNGYNAKDGSFVERTEREQRRCCTVREIMKRYVLHALKNCMQYCTMLNSFFILNLIVFRIKEMAINKTENSIQNHI